MAAAGFRTRKIKSEHSIGDRLKRARIRRKISVAEVEEATRIRAKFILALESDSWDQIPSEVYGKGYLEAYAEYLKLPVEQIMRDYESSRTAYARRCQDSKVELMPQSKVQIPRFLFTPRFALVTVLSVGLLVFGGVVWAQMRQITAAPFLRLVTPAEAHENSDVELVVNTDTVNITGQTAIGATVNVNGEPAMVTEDGSFAKTVHVQKGVNAVLVEATNSNGKVTKETRTIVVK